MKEADYNMTYFHIGDIFPIKRQIDDAAFESYFKIPATKKNRLIRNLKSNIGKKVHLKNF